MEQKVDANMMAKAFKALSNPNRLIIYVEILKRHQADLDQGCHGCLIADVISSLQIGAPTVSHHVKELVNAGLIGVERQGKFVNCHINGEMVDRLNNFFTLESNGKLALAN